MSNTSMTLGEFERLLDIYGGDRTRWPIEARAAAAHLVARDADAQRLLAEAVALDRVLERAPLPALASEAALAERIVAAAQRSPRIVKIGGAGPTATTVTTPAETGAGSVGARIVDHRSRRLSSRVGAAGLLAASLLIGIMIGHSSLPQQVLPGFADMAGGAPGNLTQIALYEEDPQ